MGLAVHTVARVCALGHGGQIIITGRSKTVLEGSVPAGATFRSLGRQKLVGLPAPETIYEVRASGLLTPFPPLRAL